MAPYLFWVNRYAPYYIQQVVAAHNGKVAVTRAQTVNSEGKPMTVTFRMATQSDISTWATQNTPFTMFGHQVIWADGNPLMYESETFGGESDAGVSNGGTSLNYYRGTLNLIIVS